MRFSTCFEHSIPFNEATNKKRCLNLHLRRPHWMNPLHSSTAVQGKSTVSQGARGRLFSVTPAPLWGSHSALRALEEFLPIQTRVTNEINPFPDSKKFLAVAGPPNQMGNGPPPPLFMRCPGILGVGPDRPHWPRF